MKDMKKFLMKKNGLEEAKSKPTVQQKVLLSKMSLMTDRITNLKRPEKLGDKQTDILRKKMDALADAIEKVR